MATKFYTSPDSLGYLDTTKYKPIGGREYYTQGLFTEYNNEQMNDSRALKKAKDSFENWTGRENTTLLDLTNGEGSLPTTEYQQSYNFGSAGKQENDTIKEHQYKMKKPSNREYPKQFLEKSDDRKNAFFSGSKEKRQGIITQNRKRDELERQQTIEKREDFADFTSRGRRQSRPRRPPTRRGLTPVSSNTEQEIENRRVARPTYQEYFNDVPLGEGFYSEFQ